MCGANAMEKEAHVAQEVVAPQEVDLPLATSSSARDTNHKPAKKPTRQWAAWTHQEEEIFFNALRQVGKNFEKITVRVQSKNKDQVRHYYYRLVRRMKKLLGPGFSLDAKNSKDTIAAMLRWWSLLEKFSCSASKLHLKPRRFKIFVEALGNQLLKDRNKTRRKCEQGDLYVPSPAPILSKTQGNESFPVNILNLDARNGNKAAPTKGAFLKRVMEANSKVGAMKGDLSATRTVKQKRRSGGVIASAAYRKWERAAMAGVSLVADAAEQLELNTVNESPLCNDDSGTFTSSRDSLCSDNGNLQAPAKLKLQLFPINEATRKALEKDEHNPHLELTLSGRKKILSVLEHLNRKWGNSNIASGELILFPYNAHQEDIASYQRWTSKDTIAVADVYVSVNSPSVFRLRYGWFSLVELEAGETEISSAQFENCMVPEDIQSKCSSGDKAHEIRDCSLLGGALSEQPTDNRKEQSTVLSATTCRVGRTSDLLEPSIKTSTSLSGGQKQGVPANQESDEAYLGMKYATISEGEWADSLTDISVGYLLSEVSRGEKLDCGGSSIGKSSAFLGDNSRSCDSFDAAIALHVSHHQLVDQPARVCHPSIWCAEETCDEFCFTVTPAHQQDVSNTSASSSPKSNTESRAVNPERFQGFIQDLAGVEITNDPCIEDMKHIQALHGNFAPENSNHAQLKDQSLSDVYWPDSLGPLDLETPSFRYQAHELVFGDSQNSWSRLMASSLDAFRNLTFFGVDKNDL